MLTQSLPQSRRSVTMVIALKMWRLGRQAAKTALCASNTSGTFHSFVSRKNEQDLCSQACVGFAFDSDRHGCRISRHGAGNGGFSAAPAQRRADGDCRI